MGKAERGAARRSGKKRPFDIAPGTSGILVTCSRNQEARCSSEILQLLEKVTEDATTKHGEDEDRNATNIADELAKEIATLRNAQGKAFQAAGMGELSCMVVIKVAPSAGDPVDIVQDLFKISDHRAENSARFCHRIIPLSRIFKADLDDLRTQMTELIRPVFHPPHPQPRKYAVIVESRLNSSLDKRVVIALVADIVGACHKVDLASPELVIMVQILKGVCGASILPNYIQCKKYNIQEFYRANQLGSE